MSIVDKTNIAWEKLGEHFNIPKHIEATGLLMMQADDLKKYGCREPRLLTKFDTRESRPKFLKALGVTILPTSNGEYALCKGDGYHTLEVVDDVMDWPVSAKCMQTTTLPWNQPSPSESQIIDMCIASGILYDFIGDTPIQTIRGRLRSPEFEFVFGKHRLKPKGVQIEVDSGFEGKQIILLEAKIGSRSNFIIRQLYYPYRMWVEKIGTKKEIRNLFLFYSNGRISLREYAFDPVKNYKAICLIKSKDYLLNFSSKSKDIYSLQDIFETTEPSSFVPNIPFPQANSLERIIDAILSLGSGICETSEFALKYDFNVRQADYYRNGAAFFGFAERMGKGQFILTAKGRSFCKNTPQTRNMIIAKILCEMPIFREAIEFYLTRHCLPDRRLIEQWVAQHTTLSGSTIPRRTSTVISWLGWVSSTFPVGK